LSQFFFSNTHPWVKAFSGILNTAHIKRKYPMEISSSTPSPKKWLGIHLGLSNPAQVKELLRIIPDLAGLGMNTLVVEVNYNFAFAAHPELRGPQPLTHSEARALAAACRENGVRLIPQFQCLGHQSWAEHTFPLLAYYPEMDETPGQYPGNQGIYCRSWCPRHPQVNAIVFTLIQELLEAFQADALHVGLDEVFLIASEHCPRCRGAHPGEIFAGAVNDYYDFLVRQHGVEMLMWGDRLLDDSIMGYGEWEAAQNGTHTALEQIPRDIIQCDWHYELRQTYPSIPFFAQAGFRVWPAGWKDVQSTKALLQYTQGLTDPSVLGHLCTTWGAVQIPDLPAWEPFLAARQALAG
jgi:hypothetical protein